MPLTDAPLTAEELQDGCWLFGFHGTARTGRQMIFAPDGTIKGYAHPNESRWRLADGNLQLIGAKGQVTSTFTRRVEMFGHTALLGRSTPKGRFTLRLTALPEELARDKVPSPLRQKYRAEMFTKGWRIGHGSYGQITMIEKAMGQLNIGNYCSIASITMAFGNHRTDCVSTFPFGTKAADWPNYPKGVPDHDSKGPITLGHDVWVGAGALITSGVTIGNGAVIAAHAVVTRDVPPYAIVAGAPAKVIRYRFTPAQIAALEEIAWWHWEPAKIDRFLPLMMASDIAPFLAAAGHPALPDPAPEEARQDRPAKAGPRFNIWPFRAGSSRSGAKG